MNLYVELKGISCNHCLQTIEANLLKDKNIKSVKFKNDIAIITYNNTINKEKLIKKIISLGYYTEEDYISDDIIKLDNKKI